MSGNKETSGVHRLSANKPRINPKTSPYVPATTRKSFQALEHHSDRMKRFFAETFYYSPGRTREDFALIENMREGLFKGIQNDDCFVGHILEPSEGVHDEIIVSTPQALVLFHCEEHELTREHTSPMYPAIKFVHPEEGLYIQPDADNGVYTINFGTVRFNELGVTERRDYPMAWSKDDEKIWKEHRKRWGLIPANGGQKSAEANPEKMQKSTWVKLSDLLKWNAFQPKSEPPRGNHFVPYYKFENRIQNASYALAKGLNAINGHIQEVSDDPEPDQQLKRY